MKKLIVLILIISIAFYSCTKDSIFSTDTKVPVSTARSTVDYTNPDPTWIQVTSPLLQPAKYGGFVPAGFSAGIQGPFDADGLVVVLDTSIIVRWHLHVGLRNFNKQLKPDVIDYSHFFINGVDLYKKMIPNGGVMGDYDLIDTVKIVRNGYYNSYFTPFTGYDSSYLKYNWNGITPEIHSLATNGWLNSAFFTGVLK